MRFRFYIYYALLIAMVGCSEGFDGSTGSGVDGGVSFTIEELTRSVDLKNEWATGDMFAIFVESDQTTSKCYTIADDEALESLTLTPKNTHDLIMSSADAKYRAFYPYIEGWSYADYTTAIGEQFSDTDYLTSGDFDDSTTLTMNHTFAALSFTVMAGYGFSSGFDTLSATLYLGDDSHTFTPALSGTETEVDIETFVLPANYSEVTRMLSISATSGSEEKSLTLVLSAGESNEWVAGYNYISSALNSIYITLETVFDDDIFYIYTLEDMLAVGTNDDYVSYSNRMNNGSSATGQDWSLSADYVLMDDIDLKGSADNQWTPIGPYATDGSSKFTGTFNGNFHRISNIYIYEFFVVSSSLSGQYKGLFGYIDGATIKNVIVDGSIIASQNIGGIAGYAGVGSTIECCGNEASITSVCTGSYVSYAGGIAGYIKHATIRQCYNKGDIISHHVAGGMVGYAFYESTSSKPCCIEACYNRGDIYSYYDKSDQCNIGGICGYVLSNITINSLYSTGGVRSYYDSGVKYLAGILGFSYSVANYCYYDSETIDDSEATITVPGVSGSSTTENTPYTCNNLPEDVVGTHSTYATNSEGYITDDMKDATKLLANLNIGASGCWEEDNIYNLNDGYPVLSWENEQYTE